MIPDKKLLRTQMRRQRRACENRDALDAQIAEAFLKSELYGSAEQLLLYASCNFEADTYRIFDSARADGKEIFFPYCVPETNHLRFYRVFSREELKPDAYQIPAPPVSDDRLWQQRGHTVCIVPGLAFSAGGERLGYGRGYYDTFLEGVNVCTVGLCYGFQLTEAVPTEPHDRKMHYLCTEKGLIPCSGSRKEGKENIYE